MSKEKQERANRLTMLLACIFEAKGLPCEIEMGPKTLVVYAKDKPTLKVVCKELAKDLRQTRVSFSTNDAKFSPEAALDGSLPWSLVFDVQWTD